MLNAEFNFIEVWLTDQNKPLEIEDNVNITIIGQGEL